MTNEWKKVLATHEERQELSRGPWLGDEFAGVALPSQSAYGKWIILRFGDLWTCAQVADVGPWCRDDDLYVYGQARPRAELMKGQFVPLELRDPSKNNGLISNGAGIDLFPRVARELGIAINSNQKVEWKFAEP